jgi:hypothetical protein
MTGRTSRNTDNRSTVFLRLPSRYVDAGVTKLGEILLPADDKAFSFDGMRQRLRHGGGRIGAQESESRGERPLDKIEAQLAKIKTYRGWFGLSSSRVSPRLPTAE